MRKLYLLLFLLCSPAWAAYPIMDGFMRGNGFGNNWTSSQVGNPPPTSSSWSLSTLGTLSASTNSNGRQTLVWTRATEGMFTDGGIEILLDNLWNGRNGTANGGLVIRCQDTTGNCYYGKLNAGNSNTYGLQVCKWTSNGTSITETACSTLANVSPTGATSPQKDDRLRLTASGTTITLCLYQGRTGSNTRLPCKFITDSSYTSGYAGIARNTVNIGWGEVHIFQEGQTEPPWVAPCSVDCYIGPDIPASSVIPTGKFNGDGSFNNPLTMSWFILYQNSMPAGTRYWLRGGYYLSNDRRFFGNSGSGTYFEITQNCSGIRCYMKSYPGEKAIFELAGPRITGTGYMGIAFSTTANNFTLEDVEVQNSYSEGGAVARISCTGGHTPYGIAVYGTDIALRYNLIRNTNQAISDNSSSSTGTQIIGNTVYNNGLILAGGPPSTTNCVFGHPLYLENSGSSYKTIRGNIFAKHIQTSCRAGGVIQLYSASGNPVQKVQFLDNTAWDVYGVIHETVTGDNNEFSRNNIFLPNSTFGMQWQYNSAALEQGTVFNDNTIHTQGGLSIGYQIGLKFKNNNLSTPGPASTQKYFYTRLAATAQFGGLGANADTLPEFFSTTGSDVSNNVYHKFHTADSNNFKTDINAASPAYRTFSGWLAQIPGLESGSTFNSTVCPASGATCPDAAASANDSVKVWTSPDRPIQRITVWNWSGQTTVNYDPTGFLQSGDKWELVDLNNPRVVYSSGIWTSGTIPLPMDATAVEEPAGNYTSVPSVLCAAAGVLGTMTSPQFTHTPITFGVFELRRSHAPIRPTFNYYNIYPTATRLRITSRWNSNDVTPSTTASCAYGTSCSVTIGSFAGRREYLFEWLDAGGSVVASKLEERQF